MSLSSPAPVLSALLRPVAREGPGLAAVAQAACGFRAEPLAGPAAPDPSLLGLEVTWGSRAPILWFPGLAGPSLAAWRAPPSSPPRRGRAASLLEAAGHLPPLSCRTQSANVQQTLCPPLPQHQHAVPVAVGEQGGEQDQPAMLCPQPLQQRARLAGGSPGLAGGAPAPAGHRRPLGSAVSSCSSARRPACPPAPSCPLRWWGRCRCVHPGPGPLSHP